MPDDAFVLDGMPRSVPAVFQIWEKRREKRERPSREVRHPDFEFLRTSKGAHFMVRRAGARAGRIHTDLTVSPSTHYFIRSNVEMRRNVMAIMGQLDFRAVASNVASTPSLSMSEIVTLYQEFVVLEDASGLPPAYCCSPIFNERRAACNRSR